MSAPAFSWLPRIPALADRFAAVNVPNVGIVVDTLPEASITAKLVDAGKAPGRVRLYAAAKDKGDLSVIPLALVAVSRIVALPKSRLAAALVKH